MSTKQGLRYLELSLDRESSDKAENWMEQQQYSYPLVSERPSSSTEMNRSNGGSSNKNPLNSNKDGNERLALTRSSPEEAYGFHHQKPLEDEVIQSSSPQQGLGHVSYFPDHIARVSYIASVVKPDVNGNYLKDLEGGMDSLATRLAPSYFPGTVIRHITTQVDRYFPAGEC